jgi:hypothetical protein
MLVKCLGKRGGFELQFAGPASSRRLVGRNASWKSGGRLRIRAHVPHMERPTQSFQITSFLLPHRVYRTPRRQRNGGSVVGRSGLPLEAFVALAVIAATLLNPLEVVPAGMAEHVRMGLEAQR